MLLNSVFDQGKHQTFQSHAMFVLSVSHNFCELEMRVNVCILVPLIIGHCISVFI